MNETEIPAPWTFGYHLRFVPSVLAGRMRPEPRSGFGSHLGLILPIATVIALVMLSSGVSVLAGGGGRVGGVILTALGGAGMIALVALSIAAQTGEPRSYARFEPSVFYFVIALGITTGVFAVRLQGDAWGGPMDGAVVFGATLVGYIVGLIVGYWWQVLGAFGKMAAVLAYPGIIGLIVLDLVLLLE